ncbi:unnamed protein product [Didymodactylos carnosus]|uniref:Uncharacterized protein n=1 Tax=Didymodactylos carnosus TaxID=1234261 RepID=A0A814JIT1_9BILA|nr:unnamed protein product [Didymodactylos carnosus]CAF1036096.1 unnamed protein product [Didymodactylos carnosus]CAF3541393.1 unnamed protein product [Didymodactylos carnosus]CAF3806678.1 unnamed protein product [Didymodactylos carnosus]
MHRLAGEADFLQVFDDADHDGNVYSFLPNCKQPLQAMVIDFVEKEKAGTIIPLNNVNDRLEAILGISNKSVKRLKAEMRETLAVEKEA